MEPKPQETIASEKLIKEEQERFEKIQKRMQKKTFNLLRKFKHNSENSFLKSFINND